MRIDGEAKEKLYSIMAGAIDLGRLYESAIWLLNAEKDQSAELMDEADALREENAKLKERCDVLERSFGDTAALEHTVNELHERNDALRLRNAALEQKNVQLEHRLSTEPPPGGNWNIMYEIARQTLGDVQSDTDWVGVLDTRLGQYVEMHETEPPHTSHQPSRIFDTDGLRLRLDAKNSETEKELGRQLQETLAELEKFKTALASLWYAADEVCIDSTRTAMRVLAVERMKEEGYDIEKEPIEGFGSSGSEDNSEGAGDE